MARLGVEPTTPDTEDAELGLDLARAQTRSLIAGGKLNAVTRIEQPWLYLTTTTSITGAT